MALDEVDLLAGVPAPISARVRLLGGRRVSWLEFHSGHAGRPLTTNQSMTWEIAVLDQPGAWSFSIFEVETGSYTFPGSITGEATLEATGLLTVSADSEEELRTACAVVETAAVGAQLDLRPLTWQQAEAFTAAALPLALAA